MKKEQGCVLEISSYTVWRVTFDRYCHLASSASYRDSREEMLLLQRTKVYSAFNSASDMYSCVFCLVSAHEETGKPIACFIIRLPIRETSYTLWLKLWDHSHRLWNGHNLKYKQHYTSTASLAAFAQLIRKNTFSDMNMHLHYYQMASLSEYLQSATLLRFKRFYWLFVQAQTVQVHMTLQCKLMCLCYVLNLCVHCAEFDVQSTQCAHTFRTITKKGMHFMKF